MSNLRLDLHDPQTAVPITSLLPIGRHLVRNEVITQADLISALRLQRNIDAPIGEILLAKGLIGQKDILRALSEQYGMSVADFEQNPPQPNLAAVLPASLCLKYRAVPWIRIDNIVLVATSDPSRFEELRACLGQQGKQIIPVIAEDLQIITAISQFYGPELAQKAATKVPAIESCRTWEAKPASRQGWAIALVSLFGMFAIYAPLWFFTVLMIIAFLTLMMTTTLKAAAFWAQMTPHLADRADPLNITAIRFRLPKVSMMVPLLHEKEIAGALIKRLQRLTYPKSLLDIVLVLEAEDEITKQTLARTKLPSWIRVIEVPSANRLTTKPRALNYALDFCKGSIIGVWDAEDAPQADQIERVVQRFQHAPKNVACLQGVLDYYNPRANFMARCFAIEYATWWRMVMPGMVKLGMVIPLGGTTLFFRRNILEELCGWDAHNVTEDADLGLRLARHGYVTELLPTVTYEEANCRPWRWVRQRSRWLKGFLITWCVHMRHPRQLLKDLGFLRFLGVQTIFLATFMQFAMMPLMWSFWVYLLGFTHPVSSTMGAEIAWAMALTFMLAEILTLCISIAAVSSREHRHLIPFVFLMPFYFTLGAMAAFKALIEIFQRPFYWDKTEHGVTHQIDNPILAKSKPTKRLKLSSKSRVKAPKVAHP